MAMDSKLGKSNADTDAMVSNWSIDDEVLADKLHMDISSVDPATLSSGKKNSTRQKNPIILLIISLMFI